MSADTSKPSYNAGRRIKWLAFGIAAAVILYVGFWFWYASQWDRVVAASTAADTPLTCEGRDIRGFPFRIGVFCDRFAYADPEAEISVETGAVRSASQIYDANRFIAEIDSPVRLALTETGDVFRLDWDTGRASITAGRVGSRRAAFEASDAALAINGVGEAVRAETLESHLREHDGGLDVSAEMRGASIDPALLLGRQVPPLGIDLNLRFNDWNSVWVPFGYAGEGVLNHLGLRLGDDRGIVVDGPFALSSEGLISGEFNVRIVDMDGVAQQVGAVFPEFLPLLQAIAGAGRPSSDELPADERAFTLNVRDGQIRAGFVPIGSIPPLRLGAGAGS